MEKFRSGNPYNTYDPYNYTGSLMAFPHVQSNHIAQNIKPMKITPKLVPILLAAASVNLARADFNPVVLTPGSYDYAIVVPTNSAQPMPACITASVGGGTGEGDHTFFEQGVYAHSGPYQYCGVPKHNAVFTDQSDSSRTYQMPPDYTTNNGLMIDAGVTSGGLTLNTATTCVSLALLEVGGSSGCTVNYTVTHVSGPSGNRAVLPVKIGLVVLMRPGFVPDVWAPRMVVSDSITTGSITAGRGAVNSNPRMYTKTISVSSASPVIGYIFHLLFRWRP